MFMYFIKLLHRCYKRYISPLLGERCRFYPYCSDYFVEAVEVHGFIRGLLLGIWRVMRCNPWCKSGYDPVPSCRTCKE